MTEWRNDGTMQWQGRRTTAILPPMSEDEQATAGPRLRIASGSRAGEEVTVPDDGLVVGRDVVCGLRLESEGVSRQHARFTLKGGDVCVEDLGSTNGVYVNTEKITQQTLLWDGDRVKVGDTYFEILGARPYVQRGSARRQLMLGGILVLLVGLILWWAWLGENRQPKIQRHTVKILSEPAGAAVYDHGKKVGVTPLEIPGIAAADYRMLLRKDGYRDREVVVQVPQGPSVPIHELEPLRKDDPDVLTVTTIPAGVPVYIDGMYRGTTPVVEKDNMESGPLLVSGLAAEQEHLAYFMVDGEKSKVYTFKLTDRPLRMMMWRPDIMLVTRHDRRFLGMIRKRKANGDVLVAVGQEQEVWFKSDEIKAVKNIFPVRMKGREGIEVKNPKSKSPVLEIDPFPDRTD